MEGSIQRPIIKLSRANGACEWYEKLSKQKGVYLNGAGMTLVLVTIIMLLVIRPVTTIDPANMRSGTTCPQLVAIVQSTVNM